jgi:ATP-dependent DNA helicase DinG
MNMFESMMESLGLQARKEQTALVEFIRTNLANEEQAMIQAGTGVGKSFAALATAFEANEKYGIPSLIVCPTNALIDQYVKKDAPRVVEALNEEGKEPKRIAHIKGRNNYLCSASHGAMLDKNAPKLIKEFIEKGVFEWAEAGLEGWGCSGDCDQRMGDICAIQAARELASRAHVVITNGHVLVWDLKVEQMTDGVVNLLPRVGAVFIDECHAVDEVAKSCNSDQIGPNAAVYDMVPGLQRWVARTTMLMNQMKLNEAPVDIDAELTRMLQEADRTAGRLESQLAGMRDPSYAAEAKEIRKDLKAVQRFIDFATDSDDRFISTITIEPGKDGVDVTQLNRKCIDSSSWMKRILLRQPSALISGTIPKSLGRRIGIPDATFEDVGTPFDYSKSVLAIGYDSAKDRNAEVRRIKSVVDAVLEYARKPHEEGGGGSLVLFTSWRDLEVVMPQVYKALKKEGLDKKCPVWMQTRGDSAETQRDLVEFKEHGHGVMGGVASLWTGVDVPGAALRQVIIYKLPWGVPTLEVKAIEKIHGRDPYVDDMMTKLVQGAGRLVRSTDDFGRVLITDSRARQLRWRTNPMSRHMAEFAPANH